MSGESRETFERDRCGQTGEDMRSDPILDKLRAMYGEMGALVGHKCHIIEHYQECGDCREYNRLDASYTKWCLSYVASIFAREKHPPEGNTGTEPVTAAVTAAENTGNQIALQVAGSAETGGEKAAPLSRSQGLCDTTSTERFEVECYCGTYEGNLGPCAKFSDDGMNARCPYCHHTEDCHKKVVLRSPNFPRSSQNQTVSSGVEGAHEGTTADKSESREPEKLNNAQEWATANTVNRPRLAESPLSSPPPNSDLSAPCSPAPFSTQLDTTTEKI